PPPLPPHHPPPLPTRRSSDLDRRSRHDGGFVRCAHLERDPVGEILSLGTGTIGLVARLGPPGRVTAAVEEVPRHDDRCEPEIVEIGRAQSELQSLAYLVCRLL